MTTRLSFGVQLQKELQTFVKKNEMSQLNRYARKQERKRRKASRKARRLNAIVPYNPYKSFRRNKHHLTNKCKGGSRQPENMLLIDISKHNLLHCIFRNLDMYQIIVLLIRTCRAKHYEKENPRVEKLYTLLA